MARNRKLTSRDSNPPLNIPEDGDIESIIAFEVGTMSISESPLLGLLTFATRDGHYDFMIDERMANAIVQEVRAFLRGDSPALPEENG
jgi:hydrogenase maturation factor HypE